MKKLTHIAVAFGSHRPSDFLIRRHPPVGDTEKQLLNSFEVVWICHAYSISDFRRSETVEITVAVLLFQHGDRFAHACHDRLVGCL